MGVFARGWEVELEGYFLCCVWAQGHVVRLHVLALKHWHSTLRDLVEQRERLGLRRDVRQHDLALVRRAAQKWVWPTRQLLAFVRAAQLLVTVDHFDVSAQVQVGFGDKFLVKQQIRCRVDRYAALLVRFEAMVRVRREREV